LSIKWKKIFDQDSYSSTIPNEKSVRFDALHGNIFPFPHKLSDPGTIWNEYDNKKEKTLQII
jgi:hypothetical protein